MMHALIDTGTSALFFVWSTWFYHFYKPGSRSNLPIGYYQCPGSCSPIQPTDFPYLDGTKVYVFQHRGNARIGQTDAGSIKFGLVYKYEAPDNAPPFHSIGLGTQVYPGYPSLMSQLQGKAADTSFALHLRAHRCGAVTGELLLGGGDPSLYVAPLTFIPLRSQGYHVVEIGSLQVGSRHKTIGINQDAVIDSGAEGLFVPNMYFEALIKDIFDQATALAGAPIHPQWVPKARLYEFDCAFMDFFPPIEIGLGSAGQPPILVTNYARNSGGICSVAITGEATTRWTLPAFILVGTYFEFRPSQSKLGVAKLAQN
ncbi:hypothetical protein FOZ63_028995 [Perkinsus olseni]|uniref:Peptidase A1 domain-containing protein n=1 Tax=Perkinsus olseni TaxID=32597 RepID=A0A7J6TTV0_PEROL|nr:hypothetical protein FOZ62_003033 [Perkinsus olseni]KAF4749131.1 hypothetical protein FOZ63_028995 [Perkinsus olseni]